MSCDGGHLGFPIGIKNSNLVKDIPMIILLQFGFSQFISFREEDLWNFSQSEHIIGPGSHIEYPTGTKNSNFVEDHPRNIPAKFGSNRPSGFGEEAWNVKSLETTDDGRQVMAIVHLDLWSRWTKNNSIYKFSLHLTQYNWLDFKIKCCSYSGLLLLLVYLEHWYIYIYFTWCNVPFFTLFQIIVNKASTNFRKCINVKRINSSFIMNQIWKQ